MRLQLGQVAVMAIATAPLCAEPVEGFYMVDNREFGVLYRFEPESGETTMIGDLGLGIVVGLAANPDDNTLYAAGRSLSGQWGLYEVNPSTGESTLTPSSIGLSSFASSDSAFTIGADGESYRLGSGSGGAGVYNYNLYSQSKEFFQTTLQASNGFSGAADPTTGKVYFARRTFGQVYAFDPSTGGVQTQFGTSGVFFGAGGIAFDPEGRFYAAGGAGGALFELDKESGELLDVLVTDAPRVYSLTYLVPAPGGLGVLLSAGLIAARRRR